MHKICIWHLVEVLHDPPFEAFFAYIDVKRCRKFNHTALSFCERILGLQVIGFISVTNLARNLEVSIFGDVKYRMHRCLQLFCECF